MKRNPETSEWIIKYLTEPQITAIIAEINKTLSAPKKREQGCAPIRIANNGRFYLETISIKL